MKFNRRGLFRMLAAAPAVSAVGVGIAKADGHKPVSSGWVYNSPTTLCNERTIINGIVTSTNNNIVLTYPVTGYSFSTLTVVIPSSISFTVAPGSIKIGELNSFTISN